MPDSIVIRLIMWRHCNPHRVKATIWADKGHGINNDTTK